MTDDQPKQTASETLIAIIHEQQRLYIRDSVGTDASECFTDALFEQFEKMQVLEQVKTAVRKDRRLKVLLRAIKQLSQIDRFALWDKAQSAYRRSWSESGIYFLFGFLPSRETLLTGQTDAGSKAEKMIANTVVDLMQELITQPNFVGRLQKTLSRPWPWLVGILLAALTATITGSAKNAFDAVIPSTTQLSCAVSYPFEHKAANSEFTVLVLPFNHESDSKYSRQIADAIRADTGLSVLTTCKRPVYPEGSLESIDIQVGSAALREMSHRNADVVVWGELSSTADSMTLHYRNEFGLDNPLYRHQEIAITKLNEWLSADCIRKQKEAYDKDHESELKCFAGDSTVTDSEFSGTVFELIDSYSKPFPAIEQDPAQLLRLADKLSDLCSQGYGSTGNWQALSISRKHDLLAVEGDLRVRAADLMHNAKEATHGLELIEQAIAGDQSAPSDPSTQPYWYIFHNRALEVAVRQTQDRWIADRFVNVARANHDPASAYYKAELGKAFILRWFITKNQDDLREGVDFLRESIAASRKSGEVGIESSDGYRQLAELKRMSVISSIE